MTSCAFSAILSAPNDTFPMEVWMIPVLSTLKSILPAFTSFTADKIAENAQEVINTLMKLKPSSAKGTYVKSINLSSTMSPGVIIDKGTVAGL